MKLFLWFGAVEELLNNLFREYKKQVVKADLQGSSKDWRLIFLGGSITNAVSEKVPRASACEIENQKDKLMNGVESPQMS